MRTIKNYFILLFIFFVSSVVLSFAADDKQKSALSIDDAIEAAVNGNPTILQAAEDIKISEARLRQSYANQYMPNISLNGSAGYSDSITRQNNNPNATDTTGLPGNYSVGVSLSKGIFEGFQYSNATEISKKNLELAQKQYIDTVNTVKQSVLTSFYNVIILKAGYDLALFTAKNLKAHLDFTQSSVALGKMTRIDLMKAQVAYNNTIPKTVKALDDLEAEMKNLFNLIGKKYDSSTVFSGDVTALKNTGLPEQDDKKLVSMIIDSDITLKTTQNSIDTAELTKEIAQFSLLPSLSTSMSYRFNFTPNALDSAQPFQPTWNVGLSVSVPIGELAPFSKTFGTIDEQEQTLKKLEISKLARTQDLEYQALTQLHLLAEQKATVAAQDENMALALEQFNEIKAENERGNYTPLDISDSELAYRQASYSYQQALYSYAMIVWKLNYLTGIWKGRN